MKKKIVLFAITACLIAAASAQVIGASAQTARRGIDNAELTVTGTASVKAAADECMFYGNIEVAANDLNAAEQSGADVYARVRVAFAPYGSIRESTYRVYPSYEQIGYTSSRYLRFTTARTDKMSEIRKALADAGITGLDGVSYVCNDENGYKNEALRLAVENARQKAGALGAVGAMLSVEELSCYPSYCERNGGEPDNTVTYTATVRVTFAPYYVQNDEAELG